MIRHKSCHRTCPGWKTCANGASVNPTRYEHKFNSNLRINYITVPVLCKYFLDKRQRFHILGGIYNAIVLSFKMATISTYESSTILEGDIETLSKAVLIPDKSHIRTFDVGLVGGMGVALPLKRKWSVGIDTRVNTGLTSIPAKHAKYNFSYFSPNTRNINIETGVNIFYAL
jgi:hypothetical protein